MYTVTQDIIEYSDDIDLNVVIVGRIIGGWTVGVGAVTEGTIGHSHVSTVAVHNELS